jgi:hypothetical protein
MTSSVTFRYERVNAPSRNVIENVGSFIALRDLLHPRVALKTKDRKFEASVI